MANRKDQLSATIELFYASTILQFLFTLPALIGSVHFFSYLFIAPMWNIAWLRLYYHYRLRYYDTLRVKYACWANATVLVWVVTMNCASFLYFPIMPLKYHALVIPGLIIIFPGLYLQYIVIFQCKRKQLFVNTLQYYPTFIFFDKKIFLSKKIFPEILAKFWGLIMLIVSVGTFLYGKVIDGLFFDAMLMGGPLAVTAFIFLAFYRYLYLSFAIPKLERKTGMPVYGDPFGIYDNDQVKLFRLIEAQEEKRLAKKITESK